MVGDGILIGHICEMCKDAADEAVCLLSVYIRPRGRGCLPMTSTPCEGESSTPSFFFSVGQVGKLTSCDFATNKH